MTRGDNSTVWAGLNIHNLHLQKTTTPDQGTGIFVFRTINYVQVECVEVEGFGIGIYVNADNVTTSGHSLKNSYIHDNGVMGWLGGTNNTLIENNWFDNNGYYNASMFQHNMYVSGISDKMIVRANKLTGSALDANGQCLGVSLNVHSGVTTDLLIENNLIEELNPSGGCWGLMVDGVGNGESHSNAIIRSNVVKDVGNNAIGVSACIDCVIENNIVVQTKIGSSTGISSPNRPTSAPDADVTGTIIRNNTVYFAQSGNGTPFYIGERGSNYVVTNNIAYSSDPVAGDSCYYFDLAASAYDLVSNNLCFGTAFDRGTTGMDQHALLSDPEFQDAPNDLRLQSTSPAIDFGTHLSVSTTDILGQTRGATPDLGAYEQN